LSLLYKLRQSEFVQQVAILLSGSALAQVLPFIAEPFITRLYTASELGIITMFVSVAVMFSIVATARYEFAILLPKSDKESLNIVALSLLITVVVSALSLFAMWLLKDWMAALKGNNDLAQFLWYVPLSVFAVGLFNTFNNWANRKAYTRNMAMSKIAESGSSSGFNVIFGYMKLGSTGLVLAFLIGQIVSVLPVIFPFLRRDCKRMSEVTKSEMVHQAGVYKKFPTTHSFQAFTDMFFLSLVVFLISYYFGDEITGYYGRTYRILLAPSVLIGGVIGQIFFRKISGYKANSEPMMGIFKKTVLSLFLIGLPIFTAIMIFGQWLFSLYLGSAFAIAGLYAATLAPWIWIKFITGSIAMVPVVFNRLNTSFLFSSVSNILMIATIVIGGHLHWEVSHTFALLSALQILVWGYYILWTYQLVRQYSKSLSLNPGSSVID